jgi:hypothetical protein
MLACFVAAFAPMGRRAGGLAVVTDFGLTDPQRWRSISLCFVPRLI